MTAAPLRVGTRGSALALWQTEQVRARLSAAGRATERLEIRTINLTFCLLPCAFLVAASARL